MRPTAHVMAYSLPTEPCLQKKKSSFLSFTTYFLLFPLNSGITVALTSTSCQDIYLFVFWFHQWASFTSGPNNNESVLSKSQTPVDL